MQAEVYILTVVRNTEGRVIFESRAPFSLPNAATLTQDFRASSPPGPMRVPTPPVTGFMTLPHEGAIYEPEGLRFAHNAPPASQTEPEEDTPMKRAADNARRIAASAPPIPFEENDPAVLEMFRDSVQQSRSRRGADSVDADDDVRFGPALEAMA